MTSIMIMELNILGIPVTTLSLQKQSTAVHKEYMFCSLVFYKTNPRKKPLATVSVHVASNKISIKDYESVSEVIHSYFAFNSKSTSIITLTVTCQATHCRC